MKLKLVGLLLALYCAAAQCKHVCYDDLGCFTDEKPFGGTLQRPLSSLPESPDRVGTKFMLYTRDNPNKADIITYQSIGSYYDPLKPTKFIVHGFLHNAIKDWVIDIKNSLLREGDYNVIGVDWSKGNGPLYTQATANTQVVGAEIARFVNRMVLRHGSKASDFHIIGHSLGSHVAGYAGKRIEGLGRITGLDPAGPYFENTDVIVRLDSSDALFVDVIHSDGAAHLQLGLGLMQPLGHVDFYPNGGKDQPDCPATSGKILGAFFGALLLSEDILTDTTACSHMASVYFFIDSINNKECTYHGFQCPSYKDFEDGKCTRCSKGCNRKGHLASSDNDFGSLYLKTQPPLSSKYCLQHHGVTLYSDSFQKQKKAKGTFIIQFEYEDGERSDFEYLDQDKNEFKANSIEKRLILLKNRSDQDIKRIHIYYKRTSNIFNFWLYDQQWRFDFVEVQSGDSQKIWRFCPNYIWIDHTGYTPFDHC